MFILELTALPYLSQRSLIFKEIKNKITRKSWDLSHVSRGEKLVGLLLLARYGEIETYFWLTEGLLGGCCSFYLSR